MRETPLVEVLLLQRQAWGRGDRPSVEALLDAYPHLAGNRDAVLDLLYNEVVLREEAGERPAFGDYADRFPHLSADLRMQFEIDDALTVLRPPIPSTVPAGQPAEASDVLPRLEGVELLDELGHGAMGTVYRGWQSAAKRPVAVKLLAGDVPAGRAANEVHAVSRLHHPHIVAVYEVKEHGGRVALVLEYVEGGNLAQKLAGRPQPPGDAARLVEQLAGAMAYAHSRGVIHRDLKPSNVLLSGGPDAPLSRCEPKISDFGLAKLLEDGPNLTRTSDILGTPSYMAPEQAGGARDAGPLADVYALGAILYEALTGRPPFVGQGMLDTLELVRHQEPVAPSRLAPGVPRDLEVICLKCLQKPPEKRYDSAGALAEDLRRFQKGETVRARPAGTADRAWKWARRRPLAAVLVVVAAVVGSGLLATALVVSQMLRGERDVAVRQAKELAARLKETRGLLYTAQLLRIAALREGDPAGALRLLDDPAVCPPEWRCFSWSVLRRLAEPYRVSDVGPSPVARLVAGEKSYATLAGGVVRVWPGGAARPAPGARALAFDGNLLAWGDERGMVTIADAAGREPERTFRVPRGVVGGLAFLPDGRTLAVNGGDPRTAEGSIALYDLRTLKVRRQLRETTNALSPVAASPDGTLIACALHEEDVQLWDTRTGRALTAMKGLTAPVRAIAFHPDGRTLAAGTSDGEVRVWRTGGGAEVDGLHPGVGPVAGLAFHPTRPTLAVAGSGREEGGDNPPDVQLWDLAERRGVGPLAAHGGSAGVAFLDGGATLLTAGADRAVKRWDFPGVPTRLPLSGHDGTPLALSDAHVAWVGRRDDADGIAVYDRRRGTTRTLKTQGRRVLGLALPADGRYVLTGSGNPGDPGEALVWDPALGRPVQVLPGHPTAVVAVACAADGKRVATACADGTVRLWSLERGQELWARDFGATPTALAFDAGVVAAIGSRAFAAWGEDGQEVRRQAFDAEVGCVALRGRLAACGGGGTVHLIPLDGDAEALSTPARAVSHVAISPDGRTLAVAGASAVRVLDLPTRQERLALPGHAGGACFVGFAGDGSVLISASRSRELRLWYGGTPGP